MFLTDNEIISIYISLKSDGDMLFKKEYPELNENVRANRIAFFERNNIESSRLVNLAGIHGVNIAVVKKEDLGKGALEENTRIRETDGLITNVKNSYLMITGADCFPVLFHDPVKNVIGAAHCGWRGIVKEIVPKMIEIFRNNFDSKIENLKVWIGPGIKSCHYSIDPEKVKSFSKDYQERIELFSKNYKNHIIERDGQPYLDLAGIIALQLNAVGVNPENIIEHPDCTFCETDKSRAYRGKDKYFSHRRDQSEPIEANAFIIHLK